MIRDSVKTSKTKDAMLLVSYATEEEAPVEENVVVEENVAEVTETPIEETVVVGDRIYTDITSGYNAGVTTICVLTGESTLDDISKSDIKPTYTFHSVKEILAAIS